MPCFNIIKEIDSSNSFKVEQVTSVVDRDIAKVCSLAINKAIRKQNKKFIAITCHEDIIDWLEPDWVFDTNQMKFTFRGYQRTRPEIKLDIYKIPKEDTQRMWGLFRKYHYLNTDIHPAADCYLGSINGNPVVFLGIQQFPHPIKKNIKKIHNNLYFFIFGGL